MSQHPHDSRRLPNTAHPPNGGEPVQVFDVLLVTASSVVVSDEERKTHPPVATPHVQLAEGLSLGALDTDLVELVLNGCEFRGHYFYATVRSAGPLYAYLMQQPLSEALQSRWDQDEVIRLAVALSRYVRDNADAGDYAARVTEYANGDFRVMPYDCMEPRHVYQSTLALARDSALNHTDTQITSIPSTSSKARPSSRSVTRSCMHAPEHG